MNIIATILIGLATFVGAYKFMPLSWIESAPKTQFGSTITTILGTDTLSSSRSVINTNFANLNADKIEATQTTLNSLTTANALTSASSLASVGTITTGVWNGTPITTPYGGTGSTTLASNQVLLGNGSGNVKVVSGLGTTGQFLTSGGASVAPTWTTSAVDLGIPYTWTGPHTFTATTTIAASSVTNNALVVNGVPYQFPSTQGASSTVLMNNGSGVLTSIKPAYLLNKNTTPFSGTSGTTTILSLTIPANTLGIDRTIISRVNVSAFGDGGNSGHTLNMCAKYGTGVVCKFVSGAFPVTSNSVDSGDFMFTLSAGNTTSAQSISFDSHISTSTALASQSFSGVLSVDSTQAQTMAFEVKNNSGGSQNITIDNSSTIVY